MPPSSHAVPLRVSVRRLVLSSLAVLAVATAALACSGRVVDGGEGSTENGIASPDTSGCAPILAGDLPEGTSAAVGSVTSATVSGTLCPGGEFARVLSAGAAYDTSPYFFELNPNATAGQADFVFRSPSGANDGESVIVIGLPSKDPGTYTGSGAPACGGLSFSYSLPIPPSVNCSGGTDTECPTGCSRTCPAFGCAGIPCEATAPSVSYVANGATDCMGNATLPVGSWTLTLTSVAATDDGGGVKYDQIFTPHGSLTVNLPEVGGGTDVAELSVTF